MSAAAHSIAQPRWRELVTRNTSPRVKPLTWIILHHSGGREPGDLATLLGQTKRKVSADFYINREGAVYKLNPQLSQRYTWHAGKSLWNGVWDVNRYSVGIEMEHHPDRDAWPEAQVEACAHLCAWLVRRYKLGLEDVPIQSHRAVAWPRGRKTDPRNFPWGSLSTLVHWWLGKK